MIYNQGLQAFYKKILASKGKLIMIAGQPGMGKTTLMLSLILHAPEKVYLINSCELSKDQLAQRIRKMDALKRSFRPASGLYSKGLQKVRVSVQENPTAAQCREKLVAMQKDNLLPHIVFVDALQQASTDECTLQKLRLLAEDFDVPVVVLTRLKKEVDAMPFRKIRWEDVDIAPDREKDGVSALWYMLCPDFYNDKFEFLEGFGQQAFLVECLSSSEMPCILNFSESEGLYAEINARRSVHDPLNALLNYNSAGQGGLPEKALLFLEKHFPGYAQAAYLNALLQADHLAEDVWQNILGLAGLEYPVICVDFTPFSFEKQEYARAEKEKSIQKGQYEWAARMRDQEKSCIEHLLFLQTNKIEASRFFYHKETLFFLHLGNGTYDPLLRKIIHDS
ncbi:MAG: DnaB-like helicase C-terminal domain-containing protein [Bacteroidales bacterium]